MRLIYMLSIAFALGATSAHADGYTPQVVPPCQLFKTPAGEVCGYLNIEDWKLVLRADAELVHLRLRLKNEAERMLALDLQLNELRAQVAIHDHSQSVVVQRNGELTKQLLDLDLKYQQERVRPRLGNALPWAVAGVATALLAGVLIAGALN